MVRLQIKNTKIILYFLLLGLLHSLQIHCAFVIKKYNIILVRIEDKIKWVLIKGDMNV